MKYVITILTLIVCFFSQAQYAVGTTTITFNDPTRTGGFGSGGGPGRQIQTEIYYPATVAGSNAPIIADSFPIIIFGHGFSMAWDAYQNVWEELVPKGYIVAFPRTEGGLSPSHSAFGLDLALVVEQLKVQGTNASSIFFNRVGSTSAIMGHSMGGGAAFLAAQNNTNITVLATMAPANTNPSSIDAAAFIRVPSLVIAGANDCVTPDDEHQIPMYTNLASQCKTYLSFVGASHCQFANSNFNCNFGESTCSPSPTITRTEQHQRTFSYLVPWLNKVLKGVCHPQGNFDALLSAAPSTILTYEQSCTPQAGLDLSFCDGTTAVLGTTIMDGYSFEWTSNPAGFTASTPNPSATPTETTSYFLTYTNLYSNCVQNDTVTLTFFEKPEVDAGTDVGGCTGSSFTIGSAALVDVNYSWNPATGLTSATSSETQVSPSAPGSVAYVLTATNTAGCSNTDTVLVQGSEAFTVNVPTGLSACANGQVQLEANVDPFSPVSLTATGLPISIPDNTPSGGLQTNNTLPTVTQLNNSALAVGSVTVPAGNYILQGATVSINHTFCGDLDIYLRAPNDQVFVLSTDNGSGNDNYVSITFADNGATVPPANTAIIANTTYLPEGITFGSYTGPINGLWRLYAIDDASADTGTLTDFKLNLLEVPTTMTYAWTPSATLNDANLSNPTATVNQPETYTVAVSNVGCTVTSTVDVSVLASPIAAAGNDVSICAGETATLGMTAENGVSYTWASIPSGFNSSTSQISVTPGASTSYVLQATNTATTCTSSDTVTVTIGTQPSASITVVGQTTLFAGDSVLLIANPNYTSYAWSNGTNGTDSLYVSEAGTYSVTLGNSVACSATSAAITIQVVQPIVAIIEADETSLCPGEIATLSVINGTFNSYSWIGTSSNTSTATVNQAGTYSVTTSDATGCVTTSNEVSITVNAFTAPNVLASDESICTGTSATLSISNGTYDSYAWSNGLGSGATATVSAAGTYSVNVTDANGCSGVSNTVTITVLSATIPTITQNGVQLSASSASAYQWFLNGAAISGATSQTHTATENGTYTVQITDANGCTATSGGIVINTISVEALFTDYLNVYPNPFADEVVIEYTASEPVSMRIYTATGQVVYITQQLASKESIQTSTWQAGVYFVEVKQGNTTQTYKLVK